MNEYSKEKTCKAKNSLGETKHPSEKRDPIHRWFFKDYPCENTEYVDNFIAQKNPEPECDIECERCPDDIDSDYVCCEETKRFITTQEQQDDVLTVAQTNEQQKPQSPKSIADFLPDNPEEVEV